MIETFIYISVLNWYVLYTKSRSEKKVALELNELGIEAYCPVKIQIKVWSDRKKKIEVPLFSSYCFVRLNETEIDKVFQSHAVVRYLFWCGKRAVVQPKEIDLIKKWLNDFDHSLIEMTEFKPNDKVTIESGPFINTEAIVSKVNGKHLELMIPSLMCGLRVKINEVGLKRAI